MLSALVNDYYLTCIESATAVRQLFWNTVVKESRCAAAVVASLHRDEEGDYAGPRDVDGLLVAQDLGGVVACPSSLEKKAVTPAMSTREEQLGGLLHALLNYSVSGINFSLPGNGGPDCLHYISGSRRVLEDFMAIVISLSSIALGVLRHRAPKRPDAIPLPLEESHGALRMSLLVAMIIVYTFEAGYKLATRQMIFLLNPCHQLCVIQIVLLAWPAGGSVPTYLYRLHLFYLHGPINACLFPVTNTLFLPGEVSTYWLEHALLLLTPLYLLRRGGANFTVEAFGDLSWALMAYGAWGVYHFGFMEPLSVTSLANLNSMLCPAISDPFYGPNWRLWGLGHQFLLTLASGKLFGLLGTREEQKEALQELHINQGSQDNSMKRKES